MAAKRTQVYRKHDGDRAKKVDEILLAWKEPKAQASWFVSAFGVVYTLLLLAGHWRPSANSRSQKETMIPDGFFLEFVVGRLSPLPTHRRHIDTAEGCDTY